MEAQPPRTMSAEPEPAARRWSRRAVSIPGYALAFALIAALLPLLLPLAAVADAVRRSRFAAVRFLLMLVVVLGCELLGLAAAFGLWLGRSAATEAGLDRHHALQWWWAGTLFGAARRLFSLDVEVEGAEAAAPGPILLLVRHASTADTLIPAVFVSSRHRMRLRYVLKRELLWDPCLDIVGQRLPNVFVRRGSGDTAAEVASVQRLLDGLGERDGILLFPEGTRFTPRKREQILERLEAGGPPELATRARALEHVLPPRLGGILGLLERNEAADLVFCAHVGFEGVRRLADLGNGVLVGRRIRVAFWRRPWKEVPAGREERVAWLLDEWQRVDRWVGQNQEPAPALPPVQT
jgi:1-acyl-sn-glycerol-3-phosphate acyltransferase